MDTNLDEIPEGRRAFVAFLGAKYAEFCVAYAKKYKARRPPSDNLFARSLGVPVSNFSRWINGITIPTYENAYELSKKVGLEVFDLLGYDRPQSSFDNPMLDYIATHFSDLSEDDQREMYEHTKGEVDKKHGSKQGAAQPGGGK